MKLLTLNCHSFMEENWKGKLNKIIEVIEKNDYDIVTFQEVSQSLNADIEYDNVRKDNYGLAIKKGLELRGKKYNLMWDYSHIGYDKYEEGIGILTKYAFVSSESFFVSENEDLNYWKTRKIVKVTIDNGELIDIYSCHLGWWSDIEESSKNQIDNIMNRVKNDRISFLMGDFNSEADVRKEGYDYLTKEYGLYDTYNLAKHKCSGITVKGKIDGWKDSESKRLDLILCNKEIEVLKSKVIFNGENEPEVSDHFGLEVDCNLKLI